MDEYQHFERLDTSGDFFGGEYINGEFFYRSKRKKEQQTEDDRLYGVFQGSDDDDDEYGGKRRRKRKDDSVSLHKPVGFVSQGVVQSTIDAREDASRTTAGPSARPEAAAQSASETAGLGSAGLGLGLAAAYPDNDEDDEEDHAAATGLARTVQMRADERRSEQQKQRAAEGQRKKVLKADPELAKFEMHGKGIGSKLLKAMGWQPGEGLGVKRDGIVKPLQATLRPKQAGLGAAGIEEPSLAPQDLKAKAKAQDEKPKESTFKTAWKQRNRRKAQEVFRTAEQVLQEQDNTASAASRPAAGSAPTGIKILDMTGPQTRVVTNLENLNDEAWGAADSEDLPFPELQHNMRLLEEMAEADIVQSDAKLRHTRDTALLLQDDVDRLQRESDSCDAEVARASNILETLRIVDQKGDSVSLEDLEAVYESLHTDYPPEYKMFDVPAIALGHALPLFKSALASWDPVKSPTEPWLAVFMSWRRLLESKDHVLAHDDEENPAGSDPYGKLLMAVLFDPLRRCIMSTWTPQQPESLLQFFDRWTPALPRAVSSYLLTTLVMPRLRQAVNEWDPLKDALPLHKWLHPWLPYLNEELKELYPTVRGKLAGALQAWQAWDYSAYEILKPWHKVWDKRDWELLLGSCIVPPLLQAMHSVLNLNPLEKDDRPCDWAMVWTEIMPLHYMAAIYEEGFFPKLHQVLHFWLIHNPKYEEVWAWFEAYKKTRLPPNLSDDDRIRHQLNIAFRAINDAQNGRPFPIGYPAVMPFSSEASASYTAQTAPTTVPIVETRTLKEWLAIEAAERGLTFVPRPGRMVGGLQVHALGKLSVIVDIQANVLKAFMGDRWVPKSLEDILQLAIARG